ncbi:aminotransferase class I/II [Amycolatopsis antarctica]|uniref:Aminotransferase n=1 Tax=Amycolatopsis antarctica TaxID=1854586 RepID=A0A263D5C7_9PSEU|nr:pyridoxal phosphate-dependent aminotransferase [Amycolatopsis antarctica]OZM73581.1 aminotransferase class I/II [Amycolatopsis antarctica]
MTGAVTAGPATRSLTSARVDALAPGMLFGLLSEGAKYDAIDLAVGTPAAPDPSPAVVEAACAAIRQGRNQYGLPIGNPDLRRLIAGSLRTPADPDTDITMTVGATEGLAVAMLSIVDPGDEVILLDPCYENFVSAVALAGGVPRFVPLRAPEWRADPAELAAAFGPRTRAIVLNTPNNPTGHVLSREELAEIAELCERWNVAVISDEVYAKFVFDGNEHVSVADLPELRERCVVIGSLSKSHAVSGWRIGYLRAAPALSAALREVHVTVTGVASTPLQHAIAEAAAGDPAFWEPDQDLLAQRDITVEAFTALGARCVPPQGSCYVMADIRPVTTEDCETFAYRLAREAGVLVTPGKYFFAGERHSGDEFVRVAFNRTMSALTEVRDRLTAYAR